MNQRQLKKVFFPKEFFFYFIYEKNFKYINNSFFKKAILLCTKKLVTLFERIIIIRKGQFNPHLYSYFVLNKIAYYNPYVIFLD